MHVREERSLRRTEMQAQSRDTTVQPLHDTEVLAVDSFLEFLKDWCHGGEVRARVEEAEEQVSFATFDRDLPDPPLLVINQIQHLSGLNLHR